MVTVSPAVEFVVESPAIETVADNDFDGTFNVNNSTLEIVPAWRLDGVLNLNGLNEDGGGHHDKKTTAARKNLTRASPSCAAQAV